MGNKCGKTVPKSTPVEKATNQSTFTITLPIFQNEEQIYQYIISSSLSDYLSQANTDLNTFFSSISLNISSYLSIGNQIYSQILILERDLSIYGENKEKIVLFLSNIRKIIQEELIKLNEFNLLEINNKLLPKQYFEILTEIYITLILFKRNIKDENFNIIEQKKTLLSKIISLAGKIKYELDLNFKKEKMKMNQNSPIFRSPLKAEHNEKLRTKARNLDNVKDESQKIFNEKKEIEIFVQQYLKKIYIIAKKELEFTVCNYSQQSENILETEGIEEKGKINDDYNYSVKLLKIKKKNK